VTKTQSVFLALLLALPSLVFRAFVLTRLWHWFVAPLGLPDIGVAHALGLVFVGAIVRRQPKREVEDTTGVFGSATPFVDSVGHSALLLVLGWAVAGMMP